MFCPETWSHLCKLSIVSENIAGYLLQEYRVAVSYWHCLYIVLPAKKKYIVTSWESVQFETNQKIKKKKALELQIESSLFQDNIQNFGRKYAQKLERRMLTQPILSVVIRRRKETKYCTSKNVLTTKIYLLAYVK